MLKAVIFDFDGVVADSEPLHYRTFAKIVHRYGIELAKERYYTEYLGYTDIECAQAISTDFGLKLDEAGIDRLIRDKTELFGRLVHSDNTIIDGVGGFVGMLRREGIRLAVCSGAFLDDIDLMLNGSGLADSFEIIVAADHVSKGKPSPEGFLLALHRLNETGPGKILPGECVVIEDSRWGLEAAAAAGMHTIAVTNTYPANQLKPLAEMVVSRLDELMMSDLQSVSAK